VKTQIIQIEPHDDTISVRDKMGWIQTGRVILVWPTRGNLLDRRLDLVLLLRHSQSLGTQIALVTNDPEVRFQAHSLGLPVYKSIRKAQKARWRRPRQSSFNTSTGDQYWRQRLVSVQKILANPLHRRRSTPNLSQPVRIGLFALAVLAVLSIAAVLIPSAQISISPATKLQELTLTVQASDSVDQINLSGILPISWANTIVEGRSSLQTTGSVNVPTAYAEGEAVFHNLTDQPVIVPEGTIVSTADSTHRYATLRVTRVPGGAGSEIDTPIRAIVPGSESNLSTGRINAIEGELGVFLTVNNTNPITGGSLSPSPAPASRDRSQLKEQLLTILTNNALQEIKASLEPEDILLTDSPNLVKVISESYSPADRQPASELGLVLRLEFQAPYVSQEDKEIFANAILEANTPVGYSRIPDTMEVKQITKPQFNAGSTNLWQIRLSQDIQSDPSIDQVVSLTLGRSPENARQILIDNLPLNSPPLIETFPTWWPVMPLIPIRIDVTSTGSIQAASSQSSGNFGRIKPQ
jgi:hypothetical protein